MKTINVDLSDILELIHCAEVYGFANPVLLEAFAEMAGSVSDQEIIEFAQEKYLSDEARSQGYSEEDYKSAISVLTNWRNKYFLDQSGE
ncbi:hypothetical protein [Synechocystis sp. CACIAM 05]|uniref:hypothetical protein n=1 Tax=Synechocystis sp. CACIAM 05 TaxID=1933929 RepID=UPI00138E657E|nr:hypothetical protein [Synechocystis sp. CACIAM 05]QHU99989.1 hypothetical protein BWK47_07535 [Synechocystis sp. CACIAM 05]